VDQKKLVEHLTQKQVEDYSRNSLTATELLVVSDHLDECDLCRQSVEAGLNGDAAFFALRHQTFGQTFGESGFSSVHLTSDQTAEYVDKNLSGESLQVVTDHLGSCEQCALAVEDLRTFRNEIAPSLDREYRPSDVTVATGSSWREKFVSLFRVSPAPAFGGAALAVILLAFIAWVVWRVPKDDHREDVAAVPSPSLQPAPASSVQPETPVAVVAQLNDGAGVVSLDKEGKLSGADNLPAGYQDLLTRTLSGQGIEKSSQLQGLTRPPSALMGSNDPVREFSVIEPGGNVLMSDRPTFRWSRMDGATGYIVEVYDDRFKLVSSSTEITNLTWTTTQALPRGRVYSWQVKAIKDGQETTSPRPPAPQAKFRVLDQAKANELTKAKRAYGSSHLTLGLLYAEAGLLKEAEAELRLLRRANPDSEIAQKLLRQIQSLRR
jgi:anti-sigma factor RsiW